MDKIVNPHFTKLRLDLADVEDIESFHRRVDVDLVSGCWEWIGGKNAEGYGSFGTLHRGTLRGYNRAHRFSWLIHFGEIVDGLYVCHKCDNPSCVNPHHLFLGTHQENMRDKISKGRQRAGHIYTGESHIHHGQGSPFNKLTEADVTEIVSLKREGVLSLRQIAKKFGISSSVVNNIWHGRKWSWLTGITPYKTIGKSGGGKSNGK